jgi:hypothetical protein
MAQGVVAQILEAAVSNQLSGAQRGRNHEVDSSVSSFLSSFTTETNEVLSGLRVKLFREGRGRVHTT